MNNEITLIMQEGDGEANGKLESPKTVFTRSVPYEKGKASEALEALKKEILDKLRSWRKSDEESLSFDSITNQSCLKQKFEQENDHKTMFVFYYF